MNSIFSFVLLFCAMLYVVYAQTSGSECTITNACDANPDVCEPAGSQFDGEALRSYCCSPPTGPCNAVCNSCSGDGSCVYQCTVTGGCFLALADVGCANLPCSSHVSGWNGKVCEKWESDGNKRCRGDGAEGCADVSMFSGSDWDMCDAVDDSTTNTQILSAECGSIECIDLAACTRGDIVSDHDEAAEVCHTSGQQGCAAGNACDSTGTCVPAALPNGDACTVAADCQSGFCEDGTCCSSECGLCGTCNNSQGMCTPVCTSGGTCDSSECPAINCDSVIKGFNADSQCEFYTSDGAGKCLEGQFGPSACADSNNIAFCDDGDLTFTFECEDSGCEDSCPSGTTHSFNSLGEVCHVDGNGDSCGSNLSCNANGACLSENGQICTQSNGDECLSGNCVQISATQRRCCDTACTGECSDCTSGTCTACTASGGCPTTFNSQSCAALPCNNRVAGWSGADCEHYTADNLDGRCKSDNTCADSIATDHELCVASKTVGASCGSESCIRLDRCIPGTGGSGSDSVAEVCYQASDNHSCDNGQVCDDTGTCVKENAQACSSNGQCLSGICAGNPDVCCAVQCDETCSQCNDGTSCNPTCNEAAGCMPGGGHSCATQIACTNIVSGWSGRDCKWFSAPSAGRCRNGGGCTSADDYVYCDSAIDSTDVSCGSSGCVDASKCLRGDDRPSSPADVCFTDGARHGCGTSQVCDATGTCKQQFGESCSNDSQCASGICSNGACCNQQCNDCVTCLGNAAGMCGVPLCNDPNGCIPPSGQCGATIACSSRVAGWVVSNQCHRYSGDGAPLCKNDGTCADAGDTQLCANHPVAVPTTEITSTSCDQGCVDASQCVENAAISTSNTISEICFTSGQRGCSNNEACNDLGVCVLPGGLCVDDGICGDGEECEGFDDGRQKFCCPNPDWSHPCQTCEDGNPRFVCDNNSVGCPEPACASVELQCTDRVSGWNGRRCEIWINSKPGVCTDGGFCTTATDFQYCVGTIRETGAECVDLQCARNQGANAACQLGDAAPTSPNDVCLHSQEQGSCPSGQRCGNNGECLKIQGQTCSAANECESGFCEHGYCCDQACGGPTDSANECFRCDVPPGNGGVLGTCSANSGAQCGSSSTTACSQLISGWNNNLCEAFQSDTTGICTSTGVCNNPNSQCIDNNVPTIEHIRCQSVNCRLTGECQQFFARDSTTVANTCRANVDQSTCPSIACSNFIKGWNGRSCEAWGSQFRTGFCDSTTDCAGATAPASFPLCEAPSLLFQCDSAGCVRPGACVANAPVANAANLGSVCFLNADVSACPDIDCTTTIKGWQGTNCVRYNGSHLGRCSNTGECLTSTNLCKDATLAVAPVSSCPDANCRDLSTCNEGEAVNGDNKCLRSVDSEPCPNFDTCSQEVDNLQGAVCFGYTVDSNGFCDATSNCITDCSEVPSQDSVVISQCGSPGCVKENACPRGALISAWDSVNELCVTDGSSGNCDAFGATLGGKCDATGTCAFEDLGGACTVDENCAGSFVCWRPTGVPSGPGVCCNERCSEDCRECGSGTCRSRGGEPCDEEPATTPASPLQCNNFVKGWGGNQDRFCKKFAGVRTKECSGAVCSAAPNLCTASGFPTVTEANHLLPCASSQCKKDCPPLATLTVVSQNDICRLDEEHAPCDDIDCTSYMSGWSGAVCEKFAVDHPGYCESGANENGQGSTDVGRCSTDVEKLCEDYSTQSTEEHRSCGDAACRIAGRCLVNTLVSSQPTRGDLCHTDVVTPACPDINCSAFAKGWADNRCLKYATNQPGFCDSNTNCSQLRSHCTALADGLGETVVATCLSSQCRVLNTCDDGDDVPNPEDVCLTDTYVTECPDIPCSERAAGWSGNSCMKYVGDFLGWCDSDTECSSDFGLCDSPAAASDVSTTVSQTCGSSECRDLTKCNANVNALSVADELDEVCFVDEDRAECGPPLDNFPCDTFVTGWNTADDSEKQCMRYDVASRGHCDGSGECVRDCSELPNQVQVVHQSCGHPGCRRPGVCNPGESSGLYGSINSICFTDELPHDCPTGAKCNENGDCIFQGAGEPCESTLNCGGGICDEVLKICCNRRCDLDCESCSEEGECTAKPGIECPEDISCSTQLKGFDPASLGDCQRFAEDRKGECTNQGQCSTSLTLCNGRAGVSVIECGSAACAKDCPALGSITGFNELSEVCAIDEVTDACPDVPCNTLLAGWGVGEAENTCLKYGGPHPGFCDDRATCSQDIGLCAEEGSPVETVNHVVCGDEACKKTLGCDAGQPLALFSALSDVCVVDTPTTACPPLTCSENLRGWSGRACQRYSIDLPGRCNSEASCERDLTACSSLPGKLVLRCGDAECRKPNSCDPDTPQSLVMSQEDICVFKEPVDACPDVDCTQFVRGWNGNVCEKYTQRHLGFCDQFSQCTDSALVCDSAGEPINGNTQCGSVACQREGGCARGSPLSLAETRLAVCDLNKDNDACPSVDCTTKLAGWDENMCRRFLRDSSGHCDGQGTCISDCTNVVAQDRIEHLSCGSVGCVRQDACQVGDAVNTASAIEAICFTDSQQHDCPNGSICDGTGTCVFPNQVGKSADNIECTNNGECTSGFCNASRDPSNKCCNERCDGECEECVKGVCVSKEGIACGTGGCKVCDATRKCATRETVCGEGLFDCDGMQQCSGGLCRDCDVPEEPPALFTPAPIVPPNDDACKNNVDCGSDSNPPKGICSAGMCQCNGGYTGQFCEDFECTALFDCNAAQGGGTCVDANKCSCNEGFSKERCEADCSELDGECNNNGICVADGVCTCDEGFEGANCALQKDTGDPCDSDADCEPGTVCYTELTDSNGKGVCCASTCTGECSTCFGVDSDDMEDPERGICTGRIDTPCGDTVACRTCQRGTVGRASTCRESSSQCELAGGVSGDVFGCDADQSCASGECVSCNNAVECGGAMSEMLINFASVNPTLGAIQVCGTQVTIEAPESCQVVWEANSGAGIDCQAADGEITPGGMESVTLKFDPPQPRMRLSFVGFEAGDRGRVTVTTTSRRRAVTQETFFEPALAINATDITELQIIAQIGAFQLSEISSIDETTVPLASTPSVVVSTTLAANDSMDRGLPEGEGGDGLFDKLGDAFRGEDDPVLFTFIGVVAVCCICIIGLVCVAMLIKKHRKTQQSLYNAYGEGKPMQQFETVTAKPSTALGDDSEDEFGLISAPSMSNFSAIAPSQAPTVGITVEPLTDSSEEDF